MILNYKGNRLDHTREHEIFSDDKNGFLVEVIFNDDNEYENKIFNNITEVHYMYYSIFQYKKIAFESEIHNEHINYEIRHIKEVNINTAKELCGSF